MTRGPAPVAALLFCSGLCALIYQTVWLRQFRLIFGASTFATAAVLAIFMAGLGIGSALLGRRADRNPRPLFLYGNLEIWIAVTAGISPVLLWLAAKVYFASGGSPVLGIAGATVLRLLLATIVLGPVTFLMGGTLPAAARAVASDDDRGRHAVALLYGVNTLGAVAGAVLSTFFFLELFGNRTTLFVAVLLNLIVGITARSMGRQESRHIAPADEAPEPATGIAGARPIFVASAMAGFAFLLMELVWYRMLSPILGGTTYMFGLILAVALFGIGAGGAIYAFSSSATKVSAGTFALTCSLETLAMAIPFALGDRLAVLANVLRDYGAMGFAGHVASWTLITMIVVFPAACIAGYQFPLLIALLGRGRENVGRQVGAAYAWNTVGAIAGSLAGGFGLLPLLSAPGTWRFVVVLLTLLAAGAIVYAVRGRERGSVFASVLLGVIALACAWSLGPTALWRHSGIGAARAPRVTNRNQLDAWTNNARRMVVWDRDGRESSIGMIASDDYAFYVNGKSDGAARRDAPTAVMMGLVGAALHPNPKRAMVIGLGTGSTSGWLAAVPSMQTVDTIELEPVVIDVARACRIVNHDALANPKVRVTVADAREALLTTDATYDLIASAPSNPYRAGIASLYTREFYEAVSRRLAPGGYVMQWIQGYAIDARTLRTIYATLTSVFPNVQTWFTSTGGDLLLVASRDPISIDVAALRHRLATEPFQTALQKTWRIDTTEQFLARVAANETYAKVAAGEAEELNTDDRTVIEFGFARSLAGGASLLLQIVREADDAGLNRPVRITGAADWELVDANRLSRLANATRPMNHSQAADWAMTLIKSRDARAAGLVEIVAQHSQIEGDILRASLASTQGRDDEAAALLSRAFLAYRTDPWPELRVIEHGLDLAARVGRGTPSRAAQIHAALEKPFVMILQNDRRRFALTELAPLFDGCGEKTLSILREVEPHPFWHPRSLETRVRCYGQAGPADLARRAEDDLLRYRAAESDRVIPPPGRRR